LTIGGSYKKDDGVMFILSGDGVDDEDPSLSKFAINAFSGELFLIAPIDRDPPFGHPQWKLNITAEDDKGNRLEGCALIVVNVRDINDNVPYFLNDNYLGNISENSDSGIEILTLTAQDADEDNTIRYSIEMNRVNSNGELIFDIDEASGVLSSAVCCLDRESIDQFVIKVCATDGGSAKACTSVIVVVIDENDELPKFVRKLIPIVIYDNEIYSGKQIVNLSVSDNDLLQTNRFVYKVLNHSNYAKYFSVITNTDGSGLLFITQKFILDKESFGSEADSKEKSNEFSITIAVSDIGDFNDETRVDYCRVRFKVQKSIDNKDNNLLNLDSKSHETIETFISFNNENITTNMNNKSINEIISNSYNSKQNNNNSNNFFTRLPFNLLQELTIFYLILIAIIILIIALIVLLLFIKVRHYYSLSSKLSTNNSRTVSENESDPDLRDGLGSYNYEGGGECDISLYDLTQLQIPIHLIDSSNTSNLNKCEAMQKLLLLPDVCTKSPTTTTSIHDSNNDFETINIFVVE
jgi:hypothetical protein